MGIQQRISENCRHDHGVSWLLLRHGSVKTMNAKEGDAAVLLRDTLLSFTDTPAFSFAFACHEEYFGSQQLLLLPKMMSEDIDRYRLTAAFCDSTYEIPAKNDDFWQPMIQQLIDTPPSFTPRQRRQIR